MTELTKRQKDILYAIVTEFIETAIPVGSELLCEKYEINASPATVRYEMVKLADQGFISKSHSSSGRVPTILGYRLYINDMIQWEEVHYLTEIRLRSELPKVLAQKRERLIQGITSLIADVTKYAGVAWAEDGIYYSGLHNLLDYPEFDNSKELKNILIVFDDINTLSNVFRKSYTDNRVKVLIGSEIGLQSLENCSVVFTEVDLPHFGDRAVIGVLGPKRLNFAKVIPIVGMIGKVIDSSMFWMKD